MTNIEMFQDLLLSVHNIYFWEYRSDMKLTYTNDPDFSFWDQYFQQSFCHKILTSNINFPEKPFLISDQYDITWLIFYQESPPIFSFYLFGPMFSTAPMPEKLVQDFLDNGYPLSLRKTLTGLLEKIPVISVSNIMQFGVMWYYILTGQKCQAEDLTLFFYQEEQQKLLSERALPQNKITSQGNYAFQQIYLRMVEEGNLNYKSILGTYDLLGPPGQFVKDNPLRQIQDLSIATIALCSRAAMRGGLNPSVAYAVSDYYIAFTENCRSISEVYVCISSMLDDYIHRVHNTRKCLSQYSPLITGCISYILDHLMENITLSTLSAAMGYSEYYLSRCFKKEVGISIKNYIKTQRIQYAKIQLSSQTVNINHLSEQLHFVSPSYFSKCFKDETGMTPREFMKQTGPEKKIESD